MGNKGKDKATGKVGKVKVKGKKDPEPEDTSKNPNDKKGTGVELLALVSNI